MIKSRGFNRCEISQRLLRVNSVIGVSEQSWQAAIALQHWKNCGYELTAATAAGLAFVRRLFPSDYI